MGSIYFLEFSLTWNSNSFDIKLYFILFNFMFLFFMYIRSFINDIMQIAMKNDR